MILFETDLYMFRVISHVRFAIYFYLIVFIPLLSCRNQYEPDLDRNIVIDMWQFRKLSHDYIYSNYDTSIIKGICLRYIDSLLNDDESGSFSANKTFFPDSLAEDIHVFSKRTNLSDSVIEMCDKMSEKYGKNLYAQGSDVINGFTFEFSVYRISTDKQFLFGNQKYILEATLNKSKPMSKSKSGTFGKEVITYLKLYK